MASMTNHTFLEVVLADKLDENGVTSETIDALMQQEVRVLGRLSAAKSHELAPNARLFALHFLHGIVPPDSGMLQARFCHAVQIFDFASTSALGNPGTSMVKEVMALAAAAFSMSIKLHSVESCPIVQLEKLAAAANSFTGCPLITSTDIASNEQHLLRDYNISSPTVDTWGNIFSSRMNVVLKGILAESGHLQYLQEAYLRVLISALSDVQLSQKNSPSGVALSCFCLALVVAELVPAEDLIDTSIPIFSEMVPHTPGIDAKLEWLTASLAKRRPACQIATTAVRAAAEFAVRSSLKQMQLATTLLAMRIRLPTTATAASCATSQKETSQII